MPRTTKLRIALFTDDFYPASGGIGRSIQVQINELVALGHDVTLLAPKYFLQKPINCRTIVVPSLYIPGAPPHTCVLRHSRRLAWRISKRYKFDVVHSQTERGGLILAARIARTQGIPHVHTFHANLAGTHASQPFTAFWGSMAYFFIISPTMALVAGRRLRQRVRFVPGVANGPSLLAQLDWYSLATIASRVDSFSAPANFMIQHIGNYAKGLAGRGHVIPTGLNRELASLLRQEGWHNKADGVLRFLSVCRLAPEKRVDAIIRAFLLADLPHAQLDIVGSGIHERALRRLAGDDPRIHFHGHLSSTHDLVERYTQADVFVLASHGFDTQAITITEAVCASLPVIYCDPRLSVGVTSQNSLLTPTPEVEDIAVSMCQLADKATRRRLAAASRQIAKGLSAEVMGKEYAGLYWAIINRRRIG